MIPMQRNPVYNLEVHAQANETIRTRDEYDYPAQPNQGQEQNELENVKSSVLKVRVLTIITLVLSILALMATITCFIVIFEQPREALTCEGLTPPNNGEISVTSGANSLRYGLGSVATYSCDPGYGLVGQTTRTCEDINGGTVTTGTWSGTAPHCQGSYSYNIFKDRNCGNSFLT